MQYLSAFLPCLAAQTAILSKLTTKECETNFPKWNETFQNCFAQIKQIITSRQCLTVVDHSTVDTNKNFVTTDASDHSSGAVLSFRPTLELAWPVAFDSTTFKDAELNYPVHEKELLAIMRALRKWKSDLLGSPFFVYTDHKTLLNFDVQKDLSQRQARWMEEMSMYDCKLVYVKGEDNSMADALSRYPITEVYNEDIAEINAQHPHVNFDKTKLVVLDRSKQKTSPLTAIGCLSQAHPIAVLQTNKQEFVLPLTMTLLSRYGMDTKLIHGATNSYQHPKA